jgi:hypothetical protein
MNTKLVDSLLETVFFGGEEGGLEDQPHPRFKWKPPGGAPSGGDDLVPGDLGDYEDAVIPPRGGAMRVPSARPPAAVSHPSEPGEMDDRTGSVSMSQMLPKGEVATTDDLIDFFARIRDAKGKKKQAWQKEFDVHKTEFESMLRAFVDRLLTETVCDVCGQEVGDRFFADKGRSGQKTNVCGSCYMKDTEHEHTGGSFPEEFSDYEQAKLGPRQSRRIQSQPSLDAV